MHFTGEIYRPPLERFNPLLEVTAGCSYNQCAFCDMYHLPFRVSPIEDVQVDLDEIRAARQRGVKRVWLVNGDPFALSADRLAEIARRARATIAELESISCHASIRNLLKFSIDDLKRLRSLGFTDLYIGIESGDDVALELIRKGCTAAQQREVLGRLREAGIGYHALLMLGVAGHGNGERNARATAEL